MKCLKEFQEEDLNLFFAELVFILLSVSELFSLLTQWKKPNTDFPQLYLTWLESLQKIFDTPLKFT